MANPINDFKEGKIWKGLSTSAMYIAAAYSVVETGGAALSEYLSKRALKKLTKQIGEKIGKNPNKDGLLRPSLAEEDSTGGPAAATSTRESMARESLTKRRTSQSTSRVSVERLSGTHGFDLDDYEDESKAADHQKTVPLHKEPVTISSRSTSLGSLSREEPVVELNSQEITVQRVMSLVRSKQDVNQSSSIETRSRSMTPSSTSSTKQTIPQSIVSRKGAGGGNVVSYQDAARRYLAEFQEKASMERSSKGTLGANEVSYQDIAQRLIKEYKLKDADGNPMTVSKLIQLLQKDKEFRRKYFHIFSSAVKSRQVTSGGSSVDFTKLIGLIELDVLPSSEIEDFLTKIISHESFNSIIIQEQFEMHIASEPKEREFFSSIARKQINSELNYIIQRPARDAQEAAKKEAVKQARIAARQKQLGIEPDWLQRNFGI